MIYTLNPTLAQKNIIRLLGVVGFAVLTAIGARISILDQPVPFTLQVMMVLAAGFTLGWRDGALSQLSYLAGIAAGMPIDANAVGSAALSGPTAGYLFAFPIAAAVVGLLAVRNNFWLRWVAGLVGVAIIYSIGTTWLKFELAATWETAYRLGVEKFILFDIAKAVIAAAYGEALHQWWRRQIGN
ncbi:MAG: biotin transporter BioY [Anaerolineae bacterium]|nr:MAG: biotin transporter BioY [Anaerolineae bacterium]MCL4877786.1 biotin transporter BioY [Anaerolineae bacterium]